MLKQSFANNRRAMKICAIVQARMTSSRVPGKVLHEVEGRPILSYLEESLSKCPHIDELVIATSDESSDDPIAEFCRRDEVECFRGSLEDVANRFLEAINLYEFDAFVRVCADCPLLDHRLVDKAIDIFQASSYDLVTNVMNRTFPRGQAVEVLDSNVFRATYPLMRSSDHREHVTSYFYAHREEFSIHNFVSDKDYSNIRLVVDTPEDMRRFERIVTSMQKKHWQYPFEDMLAFLA